MDWVNFCSLALKGRKAGLHTLKTGQPSIDLPSIDSYLLMYQALKGKVDAKQILRIRDAFTLLMSDEGLTELNLKRPKSKVDDKMRKLINELVRNVGAETTAYISALRQHELEVDDD